MKRVKYLLALVATLALVLASAVLPAFAASDKAKAPEPVKYRDGDGMYTIRFTLEGGDGTEVLHTPATLNVDDEKCYAIITWDSGTYKTLTLDGTVYKNSGSDENSRFEFPVTVFDEPMTIVMDDDAEYQITFDKSSISSSFMMGFLIAGTALFAIFIIVVRIVVKKRHR